jgi:DNA-binding CsgD family transcriptional regulator
VLQLLAQGATSEEMSGIIGCNPRTVETHRSNLFRKFAARNSAHLVQLANDLGFIGRNSSLNN